VHDSVLVFVSEQVAVLGIAGGRTLEVGSLNVNGSVRSQFHGPYTGFDQREGDGVDVVGTADNLPWPGDEFDTVVSTEALEHDPTPWRSVAEALRVLRRGGYFICTCRGYDERGAFGLHDEPGDYWRFSVGGMEALLLDQGFEPVVVKRDPQCPGVFTVGRKPL
jgi:SAM-dependent methyltransferase